MVQLLLGTDLNPEQMRYANVAGTSGRTLLALIDDILDLSKIEAGKIKLESLSSDVRDTVENVVHLSRTQAAAKGLHIESRVSPKIPALVRGDAHRLRQVLTNLSANAIKFTHSGEVTLQVTVESQGESQGDSVATLRFAVTDTGIGIRPEQIAVLSLRSSRLMPPLPANTAAPDSGWLSASN
jgi:two-component system sensor histidine kinase/response regulator